MAPEITAESVWSHIPKRPRESNKGSFGAVLAVAGSACYRGAASLMYLFLPGTVISSSP